MPEESQQVMVVLDIPDQTPEQYDQIRKGMEAAGLGEPKGQLLHIVGQANGGTFIVDVWESAELYNQFLQSLTPILTEVDQEPAEPHIYPILNFVKG